MRILSVAVLSFVLGATLVSVYGNQASTPQTTSQPRGYVIAGAAPVVPVLKNRAVISGAIFNGGVHNVDGTECSGCSFTNITLVYGGGAYKLDNSTFSGTINIQLEGAAGNTGAFLNSLGLGECKLPPPMAPPANPNRPIIHTASFNVPTKINLLSPYGQSEEYRSIF